MNKHPSWRVDIESLLRSGMRYAFKVDTSGSFPILDEEEFSGTDDTSGYLDHVLELVLQLRRYAFIAGYICATPCITEEERLSATRDAWKAWGEYDHD